MYYLGVDLGGTNIKAALVDADGAIIKEVSTPTKLPCWKIGRAHV